MWRDLIEHLKKMIFKYLNRQKTNTYLNVLQKLVQSYNSSPHRSLNNIAPKDVNDTNNLFHIHI
jgi:hypothetical protein